ncbi:RILP-like protein homolog [Ctenocephalides felis]|uniref:RILP-like protein homolog n=1 Tax=Ctenocephalides felis TaxID=7515 RepID=UPI000E6E3445|nr:RILP-like protein homolog [Ctenocephalides felis]XP_026470843.1 RILP-like protein homolog [Ctenocephalides felis]XP_026470851.1 RILP-like protein homolog [Ctenocephalides felis]
MPFPIRDRHSNFKMSESDYCDGISVVDVYDIASDIGKECEKIIDNYGADAVTGLMPKVINTLELLEALATRNERENTTLQELTCKISQLENEKLEKAEYRQRFEKELEAIEEQWRGESQELVSVVNRLQEENKRLSQAKAGAEVKEQTAETSSADGQMLQRLRNLVDKQRDELRKKDNELQKQATDIENLTSQVDRMNSAAKESRRRQRLLQAQVGALCEERADFLARLLDQNREIGTLRKGLGLAQKENEDLTKFQDENDPLRPRFTTAELKEILHERNELKTKVSELEEELEVFRPKPNELSDSLAQEEDAPVQGPLPYEPDDAPWKKSSETGIRKFFRKIFSESGGGGGSGGGSGFPRRSLSTLSKMALSAGNQQHNDDDCQL